MDSPTVKRFLPWVVATALFMEQLDSTIVNTAVPSMAASLHVTPLSLKAVVASYILSLAACISVSGWIADRFGARRVFAIADEACFDNAIALQLPLPNEKLRIVATGEKSDPMPS